MTKEEVQSIVKETVAETLTSMGIDISTPEAKIEMQRDNDWVRGRRQLEEKMSWKVMAAIMTAIVGGLLSVVWMGFRTLFNH